MAIIYISHHLNEVLDISDRITVLRNGEKVAVLDNNFYGHKKNKDSIKIRHVKNPRFAFIPENRREEGVIVDFDVGENIGLPNLRSMHKLGFLIKKKIKEYIKFIIDGRY